MESNENDISAKETFQSESSWIQSKNEHGRRKKSFGRKKSKRKKEIISLGHMFCGLFFLSGIADGSGCLADPVESSKSRGLRVCIFQNH